MTIGISKQMFAAFLIAVTATACAEVGDEPTPGEHEEEILVGYQPDLAPTFSASKYADGLSLSATVSNHGANYGSGAVKIYLNDIQINGSCKIEGPLAIKNYASFAASQSVTLDIPDCAKQVCNENTCFPVCGGVRVLVKDQFDAYPANNEAIQYAATPAGQMSAQLPWCTGFPIK